MLYLLSQKMAFLNGPTVETSSDCRRYRLIVYGKKLKTLIMASTRAFLSKKYYKNKLISLLLHMVVPLVKFVRLLVFSFHL